MLYLATQLLDFDFAAEDGDLGRAADLLFDDQEFLVRAFLLDLDRSWPGRRVLVPPSAIARLDRDRRTITLDRSREAVKAGPTLGDDPPAELQATSPFRRELGWPVWWMDAGGRHDPTARPGEPGREGPREPRGTPHTRSVRGLVHLDVYASDGAHVGLVEDAYVDDDPWHVRAWLIDAGEVHPSEEKVIIPSVHVKHVDARAHRVELDLPSSVILESEVLELPYEGDPRGA